MSITHLIRLKRLWLQMRYVDFLVTYSKHS